MDEQYRRQMIETNGIRLHTVQAGPEDGPLVVLLHGFPEFWYGWRRQIPALAAAGYRVVAPDQRGYNDSDRPPRLSAYRLMNLVNDVVGLVEALGRHQAHLVGHDWGGVVAWWAALHYKTVFTRLVILNAPHPGVMRRTLMTDPTQIFRSLYALFFQIPGLPEAMMRNNNWEMLVETLRRTSRPDVFTDEDLVQYRQAWYRPGAMTAMLNWYRALVQLPPRIPASQRIDPPTLILWGAQDFALKRSLVEKSLEQCEDGRSVVFEDATHWLQHEEPEEVNRLILEFFAADPARAAYRD